MIAIALLIYGCLAIINKFDPEYKRFAETIVEEFWLRHTFDFSVSIYDYGTQIVDVGSTTLLSKSICLHTFMCFSLNEEGEFSW